MTSTTTTSPSRWSPSSCLAPAPATTAPMLRLTKSSCSLNLLILFTVHCCTLSIYYLLIRNGNMDHHISYFQLNWNVVVLDRIPNHWNPLPVCTFLHQNLVKARVRRSSHVEKPETICSSVPESGSSLPACFVLGRGQTISSWVSDTSDIFNVYFFLFCRKY